MAELIVRSYLHLAFDRDCQKNEKKSQTTNKQPTNKKLNNKKNQKYEAIQI